MPFSAVLSFPNKSSLTRVPPFLCRRIKLDQPGFIRAARRDVPSSLSFSTRPPSVGCHAFSLKQSPCPQCGCNGTLNRHSRSFGNDPLAISGRSLRGQRVFCSNRGRRGGCGRTFLLCLAAVLPRHSLTTSLLWLFLAEMLAGLSIKAAVEKLRSPFALETFYRVRRKLRLRLDALRARFCSQQNPPTSAHRDPLLQTLDHLQMVFQGSSCLLTDFQLHFQSPFLG